MALKLSIQGYLIYLALGVHVMALVLMLLRYRKAGYGVYLGGFVLVLMALGYRGLQVGHLPLRNLFEVFLCLGLVFPLSYLSRRYLGIGKESGDIVMAIVVLIPAGFVFSDRPGRLPPALQSFLFGPHVLAYMLGYMVMAKATVQAGAYVLSRGRGETEVLDGERAAYRLVGIGFPLLTLGLLMGSWWGKLAWGGTWNWDPKEMISLATWLMFVIYLHVRALYGRRYPRLNCLLVGGGFALIVMTLLWVNLSRLFPGMHSYAT